MLVLDFCVQDEPVGELVPDIGDETDEVSDIAFLGRPLVVVDEEDGVGFAVAPIESPLGTWNTFDAAGPRP